MRKRRSVHDKYMKTKNPMPATLKTLIAGALTLLAQHCLAGRQPFDAGAWEQGGQAGVVTAVAVSPDGNWIASGSDDATVKIWSVSENSLARTLAATGLLEVTSVAFGPAGTNIIAAGYYDGSIRLWNTTNGALVSTFAKCSGKISSLAFSPNGQHIAIGCGDWITRILRLSDGTILNNGGSGSVINYGVVRSVAYSPDGSKLAVAGEDTNVIKKIVVLNTSTWATLATLDQGYNNTSLASSNSVTSLVFSPDGASLVSGCLDQTICFWSTASWALQHSVTNSGQGVTALAFATNGQSLFSGDQSGTLKIWKAVGASWTPIHSWTGHAGPVWSLACSTDSTTLVSGGDDHQVNVWQTANGLAVTNLTSHTAMITRICFAPDGSMVATAGNDGSLRLWAAQTGAPAYVLAAHTNQVSAMAFSPDATFLVSGGGCLDNDICVWSCSNGTLLQASPILVIPSLFTNGVTALAVSPDTSLIASAADRYEQVIKLWNRTNGALVYTLAGHSNGTAALAFSPNGQYLASAGMFNSGTIKLWNLSSESCALTCGGHNCTVVSIAFNPTGTLLASAGQEDNLLDVWSAATGALAMQYTLSAGARAVAFSPDGTRLAAAGSDSLQMWQTSTWAPVWTLTNETVGISSLSFSPNGAFLVFGREDGAVGRMWNPQAAAVQMYLGATQAGQFMITNTSYSPYLTVQTSSDLVNWAVLTNLVAATNLVQVADPSPPPIRFYRVSTPQ
jgi:WD40 repeat protein